MATRAINILQKLNKIARSMKLAKFTFEKSFNFLLILLPFSALISNLSPFMIEALLMLAVISGFLGYTSINTKFLKENKFQIIYLLFVLFVGVFNFSSIKNLIYGFKYEALYLAVFVFFNSISKEFDYKKSFYLFFKSSILAFSISFFIWVFSNNNLLVDLGYRNDWSTFFTGQKQAICQKLQGRNLCRFQGFLSSPNHYGLHLLFLNLLAKRNVLKFSTFLISFITFSRSSILGFLTFFTLKVKNNLKSWQIVSVLISFALIIIYSLKFANLSSIEHIQKFVTNIPIILNNFWIGHGLNFSGPASRLQEILIPESHFLQVLLNTGVIGFVMFSASYFNLIHRFWTLKKDNAYILIALFVPMLFLHPLEDSTLSIALFSYLGFEAAKLSKS